MHDLIVRALGITIPVGVSSFPKTKVGKFSSKPLGTDNS